jgi:hypothetical protein
LAAAAFFIVLAVHVEPVQGTTYYYYYIYTLRFLQFTSCMLAR